MKKNDKILGKIVLCGLPAGVLAALRHHLPDFTLETAEAADSDTEADLVLCTEDTESIPAGLGATPVVTLAAHRPERIGRLLRRMTQALQEPALHIRDVALGDHLFSPQEKTLTLPDGTAISLTDRETDMLVYLARRPARAVARDELLRNVWKYQDGVDTHTLETHIYRLRQKTGENFLVTTEEGYRLSVT